VSAASSTHAGAVATDSTAEAGGPSHKRRIPELDGIRGIAILLVLVGHYCSRITADFELFSLASLGVNVFFVLSGFLIGGIILDEHREPGFLASFYRRRTARILPIYFTVVAAAFAAQALSEGQLWSDRLLSPWIYFTFMTNFALAQYQQTGLMLNPTWSLAVEEQFYLVMPFLMMVTPARRLPLLLGGIAVAAVFLRWMLASNVAAIEVLLPCRMDSLLIGVAAALLQRRADLVPHATLLLAAALAPLLFTLALATVSHAAAAIFEPTAFALSTALLMLSAINGGIAAAPLRTSWLRFFGEISYGLYLLHEPFRVQLTGWLLGKTILTPGLDRIPVTALALVLAVATATLSWRYFERPIIEWARRRGARAR
jgi:peptidoglycan/LPS O-acetylase OafA/YrhL